MNRFITWMIVVGLGIGFGPHLLSASFEMAKSAAYAYQHDQMSYAKFTRKLLNAKPRETPATEKDSNKKH